MMSTKKELLICGRALTNAEVKALPTTAIEIIPAPGAGKIIVPMDVFIHGKTSVAYTNMDEIISFGLIRGATGSQLFGVDQIDLLLGQSSNYNGTMIPREVYDLDSDTINKALNLKVSNDLGDLTGGDVTNKFMINVLYYVINPQI